MMYEVKQLGDLDADFFDSDEGHENDGFQNVEIHTPLEDTPIKEEEKSKPKETPSNTPASNAGVIEKLLKNQGINDPNSLKFKNEKGEDETISFFDLSLEIVESSIRIQRSSDGATR